MQQHAFGAAKGEFAGEEFVEHDAKAVDVGAMIEAAEVTGGLFGRHVGGGAEDLAVERDGELGVVAAGEAEVGDVRLAGVVEQNVARLEVAMDDLCRCVFDGVGVCATRSAFSRNVGRRR